jgi:LysR family hydrogen peroxide-inducible transcriptional activator
VNLPTVKQLRYFVALEEHEHFGKAAKACFVSQSAFSVAIKELESLLNTRLVDRTNKSVTITSIGREIAARARITLGQLEELVETAQGNQQPLTGKLKMGIIPTVAPFLLPRVLPSLRKAYPLLQLFLTEDQTQRIYDKLMDGELDLILIALPYALRNVDMLPLFKDPFRLACHKGSSLVDPEHYSIRQLPNESILLLEDGHCLRDHALDACSIRDLDQVSPFSASSLLTLVEMVDADLGITYLPELAEGTALLKNTQVKTYPLSDKSYREIGLVWRRGSARAEEFKLLGEFLREHRSA